LVGGPGFRTLGLTIPKSRRFRPPRAFSRVLNWIGGIAHAKKAAVEPSMARAKVGEPRQPVTAYFRRCMYELLKDSLGPEYWQGPDPEGPLPIR